MTTLKCWTAWPLVGWLFLAATGPLRGQEPSQPVGSAPLELKGVAKVNSHSLKLEKGTTYRFTVKAEGFSPDILIVGPLGLVALGYTEARASEMLAVFTPRQTMNYAIMVDYAGKSPVGNKTGSYTLTVERATFAPDNTIQQTFHVNEQTARMEAGKIYLVTVQSPVFKPDVRIVEGNQILKERFHVGPITGAGYATTTVFQPLKTSDYRIVVTVGPGSRLGKAALDYQVRVTEQKPELAIDDQLTSDDPLATRRPGCRSKAHTVKLEANKTYQIDLMSKAFDAYLFLEDGKGVLLRQDDEGGGNHNAQIVFQPLRTDDYRLIATTFKAGELGAYKLTVVQVPTTGVGLPVSPAGGQPGGLSGLVPPSPNNATKKKE